VYPEAKRATGEAASVVLTLTIDRTGHVSEVAVAESAGPEFDDAATLAAHDLVFEPAQKNGEPIPAKIRYTFDFKLAPPPEPEPAPAPIAAPPPQPPPSPAPPPPDAAREAAAGEALEVDVQGQKPPREPTKHELSAEEITRIPGTNGDALRSISNMPGVARPPGLDGALIIRGSSPNDSQVFVDGTNIPIVYHFGGLSSVIPSEMLEKIDFYPGNFGPEYGRATGGIVDVGVRSPRKDRLGGLVQFDLIDGRFLAEGPINDNTRFMIGGRRSWVDLWLGPALSASGNSVSVAPVYYDYQAMLEHDISRDTTVRLFAFGSDDRFKLTLNNPDASDPAIGGAASESTHFWRVQGRLDTRASSAARWTTTVSVGQDGQAFSIGNLALNTSLYSVDGRSDVRMQLTKGLTAVLGMDMQWSSYDVMTRVPPTSADSSQSSGPIYGRPLTELRGTGSFFRPAAYAMLEVEPTRGLKLFPGVRADYGSDTKTWTADPRLGARYDIHPGFPRTTLKGGVGLFHQPPQPYESIAPFGTPGVGSLSALHTSIGVEQEILRPLELSAELFYKDLQHLIVPVAAADSTQNGQSYQNIGSGRTYGSEILLRFKPEGRFFGWVAYTLSRSERRDAPGAPLYLYAYDQTHILTALGSYKLGRGWQVGARFRYVTGSPYTPDIGGVMDYDAGAYSPISSTSKNSARVPDFNQLDLRIDKAWQFRAWKLSAYLDVQNVYNRKNPESMSYNYNYTKSAVVSGLPILPILGLRGEL
jgi:TonB family protein